MTRTGALPSPGAPAEGNGVSGDRLSYIPGGKCPVGHPFFLCQAGLVLLRHRAGKGATSPHSTTFSTKIVFMLYFFINLNFLGRGGG